MSNILGEPFKPWVKTQIETRQKVLGEKSNISPDILKYQNSNAPWLRLASSINLTNQGPDDQGKKTELKSSVLKHLINQGIPESLIKDDLLAKNFILQGGAISYDSFSLNGGVNINNKLFQGAYGWGGISEKGFVPPPGITQASVQNYNNGSLTRTIVDIKCFSPSQFHLIDALYMRPGYTVLLEFGHSVYLNNEGETITPVITNSDPLEILLNPKGKNQYDLYKAIESTRFEYKGNYEAVFGKISKFNWKFNPDGSYDIQIQITGMGDVIESLKLNISSPNINLDNAYSSVTDSQSPTTNDSTNADSILVANRNKTVLNQFLYNIQQIPTDSRKASVSDFSLKDFPDYNEGYKNKDITFPKSLLTILDVTSDIENPNNTQKYLTFGALLAIIQSKIIPFDNKNGNKVPLFRFNINFFNLDEDENYILKFPGQFSSNPNVCLIPVTNPNLNLEVGNLDNVISCEINEVLSCGAMWGKSTYLGRLSNIYININFLVSLLDNMEKNEEGEIALLDFLQNILKEVNISLGGINDIRIEVSNESLITFREDIPQRFDDISPYTTPDFAEFNTYGVTPGVEGSFIREIGLNADLGNDMATMIALGSQPNGNQLTANATSFSIYNAGLIDRVIYEKKSPLPEEPSEDKEIDPRVTIENMLFNNINGNNTNEGEKGLIGSIYVNKNFNSENISALTSYNTQYAKLVIGELSKIGENQQIPSTMFVPFNLSLEMDGLSGMVLYQKFRVNGKVLPPMYNNEDIDLQLSGVSHHITPKAWTTKIDAISVPSSKYLAPISQFTTPPNLTEYDYSFTPEQGCGEPLILTVPPSTSQFNPKRKEAIEDSYNKVFRDYGEVAGWCARYSYNIAYNYVRNLRGEDEYKGKILESGGTARINTGLGSHLSSLGYTKQHVASNIPKSKLIELINGIDWQYGDIAAYYANTGGPNEFFFKHGHVQIYIGDLISSKWATSEKLNYGTSFVYRDRPSDCWEFMIFRAPSY